MPVVCLCFILSKQLDSRTHWLFSVFPHHNHTHTLTHNTHTRTHTHTHTCHMHTHTHDTCIHTHTHSHTHTHTQHTHKHTHTLACIRWLSGRNQCDCRAPSWNKWNLCTALKCQLKFVTTSLTGLSPSHGELRGEDSSVLMQLFQGPL